MGITLATQDACAAVYLAACNDHKLIVQQCRQCLHYQFYPRLFCTACGSDELAWHQSSGSGSIATFTLVRRAPAVAAEQLPLAVALIDLDEGVRLMSNIVACDVEQLRCGMRVAVKFVQHDEQQWLPVFTAVGLNGEDSDEQ